MLVSRARELARWSAGEDAEERKHYERTSRRRGCCQDDNGDDLAGIPSSDSGDSADAEDSRGAGDFY